MKIPPRYQITSDILGLISKVDSYRLFFSSLTIPSLMKEKIKRISLLKSSLYSARIEGNSLTEEELEISSDKEKTLEVFNILKTAKYIEKNIYPKKKITKKVILFLHQMAMENLTNQKGNFRKEMGAIFNQAGIAVYLPPPPSSINLLINQLLNYINFGKEKFPLIKAFISHLVFEKIHPFIDGNGRVGRLLIYAILRSEGYDFGFFIPFEEYLDKHKNDYYYFLDVGMKDADSYLIFMLTSFVNQLKKTKTLILKEMNKKEMILLPPRHEEILNIIKNHRLVSFDFIRRRFLKVPQRTLRYDLKRLVDKQLVVKIGKTKGSYYCLKK